MSLLTSIQQIVNRHSPIVADTDIAARIIALLIDDRRHAGMGFRPAVLQQIRQLTGPFVPEETVGQIFEDLTESLELHERLTDCRPPRCGLSGLAELYPWPAQPVPDLSACHNHHFTGPGLTTLLKDALPRLKPRIILEVGSWLGGSTRLIAELTDATLICVDPWLGSEEHQKGREWLTQEPENAAILARLFDHFIVNCFDLRHRLIPMRTTSVFALHRLLELGINPDVILLDGAHDALSVSCELELCHTLFPAAQLILDDYNPSQKWLSGLVSSVNKFAAAHSQEIIIAEGSACMLADW